MSVKLVGTDIELKMEILNKADDYDVFQNRDVKKPVSTIGSFFNILLGVLGTGTLALPYAFAHAGLLLGSIGTILIGTLFGYCAHMLVDTSQKLCKKYRVPQLNYAETAKKAFESGPLWMQKYSQTARICVEIGMMSTAVNACVYMIFAATTFQGILKDSFGIDWQIRTYILIFSIPEFLISQIRYLKVLAPISAIANTLIMTTLAIVLYYVFSGPLDLQFGDRPLTVSVTKWPTFISIYIFAIGGMGIMLPVEHSMKTPQKFLSSCGILNVAVLVLILIYGFIGFFGFTKYGEDIHESISLNLPQKQPLSLLGQSLMSLALLLTIGLVYQFFMDILWKRLEHRVSKNHHNLGKTSLRFGVMCLMLVFALAIPNLGIIIKIMGAIVASSISFLFPSTIQNAFLYPNYGKFNWKLWKNLLITIFSLFSTSIGIYFCVLDIIEMYR